MEIIYNNILDDISEHIEAAAIMNRKIKKLILTPREFGELKKKCFSYGIESPDLKVVSSSRIMGVPFEVK
jgi:hypothetical protein